MADSPVRSVLAGPAVEQVDLPRNRVARQVAKVARAIRQEWRGVGFAHREGDCEVRHRVAVDGG